MAVDKVGKAEPKWISKLNLLFDVLFCFLLLGWIVSEVRWATINSPIDKFDNVVEYLSVGRLPKRVTISEFESKTHWIAHAPMDFWLALPSSAPAYVFDDSGALVDWSCDPGDDTSFQLKWIAESKHSSLTELRKLSVR